MKSVESLRPLMTLEMPLVLGGESSLASQQNIFARSELCLIGFWNTINFSCFLFHVFCFPLLLGVTVVARPFCLGMALFS